MAKADITTNTRPAFTWLFLATYEDPEALPVVLRTQANTESAARELLAGDHSLTFAAKIRTDCPITCSWVAGHDRCFTWMIIGNEHDPEEMARHFANRDRNGGGNHAH
ncbi:host cell division inhibitor Icd-like protein [Lelliottia wanjuensis]|uniref:host cell division inhibitor Icd-like protein n=1 Tax=Lelliottia wanjuensis TaxID=3050585 RepID=UPI00254E754B|nr:host cell division inhibitor Icd-like protein [Lelliottia sp. V86_10]MDK9583186.1 host cell division inhibitor Icd-like protein [Lelliottia sp. V86_10]